MAEFMTLKDAIALIDSGAMFDVEFCTADRQRGTGGVLKSIPKAVKHTKQFITGGMMGKQEGISAGIGGKYKANHSDNFTRNLYIQSKREIVKVHVLLITLINGKRIL
jgi:hypothetical protein